MINGLAVLGWGVGGIEAEAAMLGQPISMLIPEVIGFKLTGKLPEGATATDLVLTVTQMLRKKGVVGKFVEFYGPGLDNLSLEDQATIANMAPEYGATCGFFPISKETIDYLSATGRLAERVALVEAYAKAQGLWRADMKDPVFTDTLELDLADGRTLASPARNARRTASCCATPPTASPTRSTRNSAVSTRRTSAPRSKASRLLDRPWRRRHRRHHQLHQHVEPERADRRRPGRPQRPQAQGSTAKPWVKTSLAPGSQVVTDYLDKAGLTDDLDALGFNLVGYGCTTCIGNSGPLPDADLRRHRARAISSPPRCSRATATSKAA